MNKLINYVLCCFLLLSNTQLVAEEQSDCVILLHGMGRTSLSLWQIETALQEAGYQVWNDSYPSLTQSVEEIAEPVITAGLEFCDGRQSPRVHFVTHSLGGIIVRFYLQDNQIDNLGRIVMLAPPNKGSEVTDEMKEGFFYKTFMGPAGQSLGTDDNSLPNQLKPIPGEIGIIAGEKNGEPWFLPEIPGDDDGKVAVERTKLSEMKDFLLVQAGHTFIMQNDEVIQQVLYFLKHGTFNKI